MLEKHLSNSFLMYLVVEILQLVHETSSFPEVLYKIAVLKNLSKFSDKHKKQSSGGVLSKDVLKNIAKFTKKIFAGVSFLTKSQAGRSSHWRWSVKQDILKNFANFWRPATLLKKTRTQVFPSKICKHFKNNYFEEHLWTQTSKYYLKRDLNTGVFLWILWIIQQQMALQTANSKTPVRGSFFNKI